MWDRTSKIEVGRESGEGDCRPRGKLAENRRNEGRLLSVFSGERCVEMSLCTWTDILQWQLLPEIHLREVP